MPRKCKHIFPDLFCLTSIIHPDFCSCSFTKAPNKIKVWKLLSRPKTCRNWCSMSRLSFFEHFSLPSLGAEAFLTVWMIFCEKVETDNDWIFWNTGNHITFYGHSGSGSLTTWEWSIFFKWTTKAAMFRVLLNRPIRVSICSVLITLLYIPVITFVTMSVRHPQFLAQGTLILSALLLNHCCCQYVAFGSSLWLDSRCAAKGLCFFHKGASPYLLAHLKDLRIFWCQSLISL